MHPDNFLMVTSEEASFACQRALLRGRQRKFRISRMLQGFRQIISEIKNLVVFIKECIISSFSHFSGTPPSQALTYNQKGCENKKSFISLQLLVSERHPSL